MAHAHITVGYPYWGYLRQLNGHLGTRLDESKGVFRRTFTFYGTDEQIGQAYAEFQRLKELADERKAAQA